MVGEGAMTISPSMYPVGRTDSGSDQNSSADARRRMRRSSVACSKTSVAISLCSPGSWRPRLRWTFARRSLSRRAARCARGLARDLRADADAAFEPVGRFEHLEAQVAVERLFAREEVADDAGGARVALPADEGREPAVDEEDFARALQRREFRERGLEVGERERRLPRRVEGAEARLDPALGQLLVIDELAEVPLLRRGVRRGRPRRVGVAARVVGPVGLALLP